MLPLKYFRNENIPVLSWHLDHLFLSDDKSQTERYIYKKTLLLRSQECTFYISVEQKQHGAKGPQFQFIFWHCVTFLRNKTFTKSSFWCFHESILLARLFELKLPPHSPLNYFWTLKISGILRSMLNLCKKSDVFFLIYPSCFSKFRKALEPQNLSKAWEVSQTLGNYQR